MYDAQFAYKDGHLKPAISRLCDLYVIKLDILAFVWE